MLCRGFTLQLWSSCGAARKGQLVLGQQGRARRRLNNFCFLPVMLSVVSQQSLPLIARKCSDAPVFPSSWDCFVLTGAFVTAVFVVAFPRWKCRGCLMLAGCELRGERSDPCVSSDASPASAGLALGSPRDPQHPAPAGSRGRGTHCSQAASSLWLAQLVPALAAWVRSPAVTSCGCFLQ